MCSMAPDTSDEIEDSEETVYSCAHCRTDATLFCNGCYHAPNAFGGQLETTLAFYRYLEPFFELGIDRIEKLGNDLHLYEAHEELYDAINRIPHSWEFFTNEEDKLSAVTYLTCGNALGFVHVLLEIMLPDIISKIARVDYTLKNHERRVVMIARDGYHNDNTESLHCIIKADLKNGESYAIDVTGAQYGWYDAILPWDLYMESRVDRIESVHYLRKIEDCEQEVIEKAEHFEKTQEELFAEVFVTTARMWEKENGAFEAMLKGKEKTFESKQAGLLNAIEAAVIEQKEEMEIVYLPEAVTKEGFNE
ncbi:hypothetical protein P7C71_g4724, partial [Lecanoromycetidae sp. Uapishka_2]